MLYTIITPLEAKSNFNFLFMRSYYIFAILIIIISIAAFLWSFEKRKPKTREVVLLAVMTSLAIVGRLAFFMTPQFKPCAAIIIITGIMLGRQSGFLCGVLTAFVSDFFFGQGPWTPWQMIAFGLIGLLSAIIFSGKRLKIAHNRVIISVYGFIITFFLYGIIMDTATVFMYTDEPKLSAFIATYMSGIFFNFVHGFSTFVFLFLVSGAIFKKVERLKIKFHIF
jgi:energy-coupling factor transport system substrate-specific component